MCDTLQRLINEKECNVSIRTTIGNVISERLRTGLTVLSGFIDIIKPAYFLVEVRLDADKCTSSILYRYRFSSKV